MVATTYIISIEHFYIRIFFTTITLIHYIFAIILISGVGKLASGGWKRNTIRSIKPTGANLEKISQ